MAQAGTEDEPASARKTWAERHLARDAGHRYVRMDEHGQPLAVNGQNWSDTGQEADGTQWSCVGDQMTGLVWEVKRPEATGRRAWQNRNHWHTFWRPATASRPALGQASDEAVLTPEDGYPPARGLGLCDATVPACNTAAYVHKANAQRLCGHRDWRLPTLDELKTLLTYRTTPGAGRIDAHHFPDLPDRDDGAMVFWTGDLMQSGRAFNGSYCGSDPDPTTCVWSVNFSGQSHIGDLVQPRLWITPLTWPGAVRVVRDGARGRGAKS